MFFVFLLVLKKSSYFWRENEIFKTKDRENGQKMAQNRTFTSNFPSFSVMSSYFLGGPKFRLGYFFRFRLRGLKSTSPSQANSQFQAAPATGFRARARVRSWVLLLAWVQLALLLSSLVVFNQAAKSIPGFSSFESTAAQLINLSIGVVQGLLSGVVVPTLAKRGPRGQHAYILLNLLTNCLCPAGVVVYLDSACLGHWSQWWAPCASSQPGQLEYIHPVGNPRSNLPWSMKVVRRSDVCNPQRRTTLQKSFRNPCP